MVIENFYSEDKQVKVVETTGFDWSTDLCDEVWFHIEHELTSKGLWKREHFLDDIRDYVSAKLVITIDEIEED